MDVDILGSLNENKQENRFVAVMADRYSIVSRNISTVKVAAPLVAAVFLENCIIPYEILNTVLTNNGP